MLPPNVLDIKYPFPSGVATLITTAAARELCCNEIQMAPTCRPPLLPSIQFLPSSTTSDLRPNLTENARPKPTCSEGRTWRSTTGLQSPESAATAQLASTHSEHEEISALSFLGHVTPQSASKRLPVLGMGDPGWSHLSRTYHSSPFICVAFATVLLLWPQIASFFGRGHSWWQYSGVIPDFVLRYNSW